MGLAEIYTAKTVVGLTTLIQKLIEINFTLSASNACMLCRGVSITDSVLVDLCIHTFLLLGTTRNITFKKMSPSNQSEIIAFSIGDIGGGNFAGGRQRATQGPDSLRRV